MSDPIIPTATERPFNVFVGSDKSPQFVAEPGFMVIQFRTDTPAFDGFPHEKDSAIKLVISQAQAALKDVSRRNHEQGVATYPWHALNDSNGIQVGDVAHVDAARHWPALEGSSSGVRIEFDMAALYRARSVDRYPWGESLLAVVRQLEDFKHDVHKTAEVTYIDPVSGQQGGVVSIFKRSEPPSPKLEAAKPGMVNYLQADAFSQSTICCNDEYAEKPEVVFVSIRQSDIDTCKTLLREQSSLKAVVIQPAAFEWYSSQDHRYEADIFISRDHLDNDRVRLVFQDRFSGTEFDLTLHDGLKTELTALPRMDELEAHCSQESTSDLEPN